MTNKDAKRSENQKKLLDALTSASEEELLKAKEKLESYLASVKD